MIKKTNDNRDVKLFNLENYIKSINKKVNIINKKLVSESEFRMIGINDYELLLMKNYKVKNLKDICKFYRQKINGNKEELINRIYNFLRIYSNAIKIQKMIRFRFWRKYINAKGEGFFNRNKCNNKTDFLSMELVEKIPDDEFLSIRCDDGMIYGFELQSILGLFNKNNGEVLNPYNRQKFPNDIKEGLENIIKYGKILGKKISNVYIEENIPASKKQEFRLLSLFQNIDSLGHYTDSKWLDDLNKIQLIRYIRELADIWCYRAQLDEETKREICPPLGDPFRNVNLHILPSYNFVQIRDIGLNIIEKLILRGITEANRFLGSNYVLSALTLVNNEAAIALPWLYEAVVHVE